MQATDKKYFIDPISKASDTGPSILVIDCYNMARSEKFIDTIIEVKVEGTDTPGVTTEGRYWHTSREGYYLAGPVLNCDFPRRTEVIGWIEGSDYFMYGRLGYQNSGSIGRILHNCVRSDQQSVGLHNLDWTHVTHWARAASWAPELMPQRQDSAELVEAKLQKARTLWEARRTMVEIVRQGHNRGWTNDLESLRSAGFAIDDPVFSHTVSTQALIGAGSVSPAFIDANRREQIRELAGGTPPQSVQTFVGVPVTVQVDDLEDARTLTHGDVLRAVSRRFPNQYGLNIGSYSADRIVTDVKPHVDPVPATA